VIANALITLINDLGTDLVRAKADIDEEEKKFEQIAKRNQDEQQRLINSNSQIISKFPKSIYEDYPKQDRPCRQEYANFVQNQLKNYSKLEPLVAHENYQRHDDLGKITNIKPFIDFKTLTSLPETALENENVKAFWKEHC